MGFTQTATYNQPVIAYANTAFTVGGSTPNPLIIPMILEGYTPPQAKANVNIVTTMPYISPKGLAVGGSYVSHAATELPKLQLDGFMDTPLEAASVADHFRPTVVSGGIRYTYADVIVAHLEGRVADWERTDPSYFRDPYGRQWDNPRVLDFTASYVEGVPGRTKFTMQLLVS